jgi:ABC-type glycerol-3-phosphate transport system permease component
MAMTLVSVIPMLAVFFMAQRCFIQGIQGIQGITVTGVKG